MKTASSDAPSGAVAPPHLPLAAIALYAAPTAGLGFMDIFASTYLMKFSTDVLGIAAATMGVIFLVSRIVGAVSDPLAGFLSDSTRTRLGRRRPWLLGVAIPLAVVFACLWSPPASLAPAELALWTGVCVVLYQATANFWEMPHAALGAELSDDYHDRNRIFGTRRVVFGVGALVVFAAIGGLASASDPRAAASRIAVAASLITTVLMISMALWVRERAEYQGRGGTRPLEALADVWRNPHARLLLFVFFTQQLGVGTITVVAAYHTDYVLGSAGALPLVLGSFFAVSIACVPLWIALGRRFEKKTLLVASMAMVCLAFGGMFFVGRGDVALLVSLAGLAGAAGSAGDVVFPSLQADVIDWDELRTGERKEGVYFASWNFVAKTAQGVAGVATGLMLAASGFRPNQPQTEAAMLTIRALMSGYPLLCYALGALAFLRFRLDRAAHAALRAELDARRIR